MTASHPDIGQELRRLAQTILDRLDPAVRLAGPASVNRGGARCVRWRRWWQANSIRF